jgi:putative copper export protein
MSLYGLLLATHVLAASIWIGGHLVLSLVVLPKALKQSSPAYLLTFEAGYEKIGIPSLMIQVVTGLMLAYHYVPSPRQWLSFSNPFTSLIGLKIILLLATIFLAVHARFFLIPNLDQRSLSQLAWHIRIVTLLAVALALVGIGPRAGWLV